MTIRLPRGLGDAIYCYAPIKKLKPSKIITNYPEVFTYLPFDCEFSNDYKSNYDLKLDYTDKRSSKNHQYVDILNSCNLPYFRMHLDWHIINPSPLVVDSLSEYKTNCIIKEPCKPHMHKKRSHLSFESDPIDMQEFVDLNKNFNFISVGHDESFIKRLNGIDHDLNNRLSIKDLIDLVYLSDVVVTQVGHLLTLAHVFNKKLSVFYPKIETGINGHIKPHKFDIKNLPNQRHF